MTTPRQSLNMIGLFEAEVLLELMLRHWQHPLADDSEFRNDLLETAADVLRAALSGEQLIDDLPPANMNLIAALWYAESAQLSSTPATEDAQLTQRIAWMQQVRKALPSCFCASDQLF